MKRQILFIAIAASFLLGCDDDHEKGPGHGGPKPGATVTVQFRGDALGASGSAIPPLTDVMNGAPVSVGGTLVRSDPEWVVLDVSARRVWIPRSNVLLMTEPNAK